MLNMDVLKDYQVVFDLFGVVWGPAFCWCANPDWCPGDLVDHDVRVFAQVDVATVVALLANHLGVKKIRLVLDLTQSLKYNKYFSMRHKSKLDHSQMEKNWKSKQPEHYFTIPI